MMVNTDTGSMAQHLRKYAIEIYNETTSDVNRVRELDDLGSRVDLMLKLIYGYTCIDDSSIDTDDEIINWTFVDVAHDLISAIWNVACGFYKTSASCLRNSLDVAIAALYFQVQENENPVIGGYNKSFAEWDCGNNPTPNWGTTKPYLLKQTNLKSFNEQFSCNIIEEVYNHFKHLCNFTHGRPFDPSSNVPTNSMNIGLPVSGNNFQEYDRFIGLVKETISWIVSAWLVTFPQIIKTDPQLVIIAENLLINRRGQDVLRFVKQ